ncbi:MAG: hypothetical protein HY881_19120 [Deltaproteobacteria bacterium]|nr:hypothetical protein [Deltaproteobacteria bacterium]
MLKEFGDIAVKLSRNPLGVLALAFVFVYGIAGYVSASSSFQGLERLILVLFIVLFPVFILIAFYRLVAVHSTKLFGPSDFGDEKNFLAYTSGRITHEEAKKQEQAQQNRTPMEYKILNTLWTKQVNIDPDFSVLWTFRIDHGSPEFPEFRIASSKLMGEELVGETNDGQVFLTLKGFDYCKKHYKEFPAHQWWPDEPVKQDKLEKALKNG